MISKDMAENMADKMFDLSFEGFSTQDLAKRSGVTEKEAIFLQSASTDILKTVFEKMQSAIEEIYDESTKNILSRVLPLKKNNNSLTGEIYIPNARYSSNSNKHRNVRRRRRYLLTLIDSFPEEITTSDFTKLEQNFYQTVSNSKSDNYFAFPRESNDQNLSDNKPLYLIKNKEDNYAQVCQ